GPPPRPREHVTGRVFGAPAPPAPPFPPAPPLPPEPLPEEPPDDVGADPQPKLNAKKTRSAKTETNNLRVTAQRSPRSIFIDCGVSKNTQGGHLRRKLGHVQTIGLGTGSSLKR